VAVDNLKWDAYLYLYSLFTDIYNPNKISIDVLTLDLNAIQSNIEFGANQVQTLIISTLLVFDSNTPRFRLCPVILSVSCLLLAVINIGAISIFCSPLTNILFESFLAQIPANKLINYLSPKFVGDDVYTWIKQSFLAGTLQDSKLKIKQNLFKWCAF
jgi:hypothetical protein